MALLKQGVFFMPFFRLEVSKWLKGATKSITRQGWIPVQISSPSYQVSLVIEVGRKNRLF